MRSWYKVKTVKLWIQNGGCYLSTEKFNQPSDPSDQTRARSFCFALRQGT